MIRFLVLVSSFLCGSLAASGQTQTSYALDAAGGMSTGGAFTAVADDANALYFNPAALVRTDWLAFQGSSAFMSLDRSHYEGVAVYNMPEVAAFGVSFNRFGISDIEQRDATGNLTGTFRDSELALTVGAGRQVHPYLGVGASFCYLRHALAGGDASGRSGLDARSTLLR